MNISMSKSKVLGTLKENRQNHIDEYAKQVQGWKKAMEKYNEEMKQWSNDISEDIFNKNKEKSPVMPYKPVSHIDDYDQYIELLEQHEPTLITLEQYEYQQIIKNEFNWTQGFLTTSANYVN